MNDREFEDLVSHLAEENHDPAPVPRERMWRQIQAQRTEPKPARRSHYWQMSLAVAALLVIGIGIG